jgi:hypothetical protein
MTSSTLHNPKGISHRFASRGPAEPAQSDIMADVKEESKATPLQSSLLAIARPPTPTERIVADGKRKAEDDPVSPAASKRVKHDEDAAEATEQKPVEMKPIPFPEKVRDPFLSPPSRQLLRQIAYRSPFSC